MLGKWCECFLYALRERSREWFNVLNSNGLETCCALVHEDLERGEEKVGKEGRSF